MTQDGFLQFSMQSLGIYAIIVNPNPDTDIQSECGFICMNHLMLLIIAASLIGFAGLMIYVIFICCYTKKPIEVKKQLFPLKKKK